MCPKPNNTASELSKKSHVEDLTEPTPDLFIALTEDRDPLQRWLTFTFPVDLDIALFKPKLDKEIKYKTINSEQEVIPLKDLITVNCTVAYMSQCMSWNKCKASCISMGASSYRYNWSSWLCFPTLHKSPKTVVIQVVPWWVLWVCWTHLHQLWHQWESLPGVPWWWWGKSSWAGIIPWGGLWKPSWRREKGQN